MSTDLIKGIIIFANKEWIITLSKTSLWLYRKEGKGCVEEDSMSIDTLLQLWLRDIQGGAKHDVS